MQKKSPLRCFYRSGDVRYSLFAFIFRFQKPSGSWTRITAQSMMPQPKSSRPDRNSCSSTAAPSTLNTDSMLKRSVTATGLPSRCAANWSV